MLPGLKPPTLRPAPGPLIAPTAQFSLPGLGPRRATGLRRLQPLPPRIASMLAHSAAIALVCAPTLSLVQLPAMLTSSSCCRGVLLGSKQAEPQSFKQGEFVMTLFGPGLVRGFRYDCVAAAPRNCPMLTVRAAKRLETTSCS